MRADGTPRDICDVNERRALLSLGHKPLMSALQRGQSSRKTHLGIGTKAEKTFRSLKPLLHTFTASCLLKRGFKHRVRRSCGFKTHSCLLEAKVGASTDLLCLHKCSFYVHRQGIVSQTMGHPLQDPLSPHQTEIFFHGSPLNARN